MSSIYNSANTRFQEKLGADESEKARHNINRELHLFNKKEVCRELNIGLSSLNKLLELGKIQPAPISVKRTLFTYKNIKDYIDSLNKQEV